MCAAFDRLSAGRGNKVLLVNCIELYGRIKHQDVHSKRFNGTASNSSAPTGDEIYEPVKVCNVDIDNSLKHLWM